MLNLKIKYLILFVLIGLSNGAIAVENPPNWPWRGVNIENINFTPDQFNKVLKTIQINSVQLRLRPRKLAKVKNLTPDQAWKQSLKWADSMLDECKKAGVGVILTVEGFPIDPETGYNQVSPKFWSGSEDKKEVIQLATELSNRFKARGTELLAYQLISEPVMRVLGKSFSPPQWNLFQMEIIKAIRENDPERWIAVASAPWGLPSSYKNYKVLPFKNIVYGAHMYSPQAFTHQGIRKHKQQYFYPGVIKGKVWNKKQLISEMSVLRNFQVQNQVPIWIGEFSAIRWAKGAEVYIIDLVSIFEDYGWAWTYFSLNGWHGWNPDYNERLSKEKKWNSQFIGKTSNRWATLRQMFNTK